MCRRESCQLNINDSLAFTIKDLLLSTATLVTRPLTISRSRFALLLAVLLTLLPLFYSPAHNGDANEYILSTLALATHGTPELRLDDLHEAERLAPELTPPYALLEAGMRDPNTDLYAAYYRGRGGDVYSVHFFGYPLLATLPFKALRAAGLPPLRCFQIVNLTLVFILGLSLYRLFDHAAKALSGVVLFMLCGGMLYWNWSSPECVSAAALLAGLVYFSSAAPLRGGLLAGIATLQNPTIVFFFGFAPVLFLCLHYQAQSGWRANIARALQPRHLAGIGLGLALFASAPLFNLWAFGVPNIIAKTFTNTELIGHIRLVSFYFDLNQGMIVAIPGLLAALLLALWLTPPGQRKSDAIALLLCALFSVSLALPALAINNWNSGATGVMRYAFWSAMPFLFVLLWRLRRVAAWPAAALLALALAQAGCMLNALNYEYLEFSPLERWLFIHAPGLINPEPEIFAERSKHNDDYLNPAQTYSFIDRGRAIKSIYNLKNPDAEQQLCGPGAKFAPGNHFVDSYFQWRYINGPLQCESRDLSDILLSAPGRQGAELHLQGGWGNPEHGGGDWTGAWSDGPVSRVRVALGDGPRPAALRITGHYFDGVRRSRVLVNGVDLGWQQLNVLHALPLQALPYPAGNMLEIELRHEAPHPAGDTDNRALAFFLQKIILQTE